MNRMSVFMLQHAENLWSTSEFGLGPKWRGMVGCPRSCGGREDGLTDLLLGFLLVSHDDGNSK